jgi:TetR/AcrR family transcriptional regulator, cholesterol catabolism regulator
MVDAETPSAVTGQAPADGLRRARGRPRKSASERDDGNRRRELIAAAARLFRQQGFAATSTRDIAAAVGMRSGSPFYHFDSKQALLAAVMAEGMRSALERQAQAMAAVPPPRGKRTRAHWRDSLHALVRNHLEVLLGPDSDFIPVMLYEWRSLSDAQRQAIKLLKDDYEAAWVPVLAALHADGQLAGDPALARLMIFGALNWTVQWYVPPPVRRGRARARASLDELTDTALKLFLREAS